MSEANLLQTASSSDDAAPRFDWKRLYQGALFETDSVKLRARIVDAQIAVLRRSTELVGRPPCREHRDLEDAWRFLHLLEYDVPTRANQTATKSESGRRLTAHWPL